MSLYCCHHPGALAWRASASSSSRPVSSVTPYRLSRSATSRCLAPLRPRSKRLILECVARIASAASSRVMPLASRNRRSCAPSAIRNAVGPDRAPASAPSGSSATSRQLPFGLLCSLLRQVTPRSPEAAIPLYASTIGLLSPIPLESAVTVSAAAGSTIQPARSSVLFNHMFLRLFLQLRLRLHDLQRQDGCCASPVTDSAEIPMPAARHPHRWPAAPQAWWP